MAASYIAMMVNEYIWAEGGYAGQSEGRVGSANFALTKLAYVGWAIVSMMRSLLPTVVAPTDITSHLHSTAAAVSPAVERNV